MHPAPYVILEVPENAADVPELDHLIAAGYRPGDAFVVRAGVRMTAIRVLPAGAVPFAMTAFDHLMIVELSSDLAPSDVPLLLRTAVGQTSRPHAGPQLRLVD